MKYCDKCKVSIRGNDKYCPLCQGHITGEDEEEVFPYIQTIYKQYSVVFRILLFISVVIGVLTVAINFMFHEKGYYLSVFVILGIVSVWLSLSIAIRSRKNLPQNILYQVIIVSLLSLLWDYMTDWVGWSIDFVIPITCICGMVATIIVTKIMKSYIEGQLIYIVLIGILGIIPILFLTSGIVHIILPSLICICLSIITLSFMMIFNGKKTKSELKRRLHF